MLSGVSRKRSIRSSPCWFTEFCNSQCLSHFAAPFIVVRAETSVAESCVRKRYADESGTKVRSYARDSDSETVLAGADAPAQTQTSFLGEGDEDGQALPSNRATPYGGIVCTRAREGHARTSIPAGTASTSVHVVLRFRVRMILPQVHLRKPCYDFSFL